MKINLKIDNKVEGNQSLTELAKMIGAMRAKVAVTKDTDAYTSTKKNLAYCEGLYRDRVEAIAQAQRPNIVGQWEPVHVRQFFDRMLNEKTTIAKESGEDFADRQMKISSNKLGAEDRTLNQQITDAVKEGIQAGLPQAVEAEIKRRDRIAQLRAEAEELENESGEISDEARAEIAKREERQRRLQELNEELDNI